MIRMMAMAIVPALSLLQFHAWEENCRLFCRASLRFPTSASSHQRCPRFWSKHESKRQNASLHGPVRPRTGACFSRPVAATGLILKDRLSLTNSTSICLSWQVDINPDSQEHGKAPARNSGPNCLQILVSQSREALPDYKRKLTEKPTVIHCNDIALAICGPPPGHDNM